MTHGHVPRILEGRMIEICMKSGRMVARSRTPQRYNSRVLRSIVCWPVLTAVVGITSLGNAVQPGPLSVVTPVSFRDAKPILERLAASVPPELAGKSASELESAWGEWVSQRNREIRARLERGDEDSIVNFLLFGTTFTTRPRALNRAAEIVRGRTTDLIAGIASPGENERLQFVREVVARRGIDPTTATGREQARLYFGDLLARVASEMDGYGREIQAVRSTPNGPEFAVRSSLYRTRGLSSDTSIRPDFAIDSALETLTSKGMIKADSIRRVGIIGPGLDFTDKAEGWDFYPPQTTQPFSVIDSLRRLGLARTNDFRLTTFDVSPRVNRHLEAARERARRGESYVVVLPRDRDGRWRPNLIGFWKNFGNRIGEATNVALAPPDGVDVRAARMRPDVVSSLEVRDLNIVVERLAPLADEDRFDLIVATNILVYYNVFEQSLALSNIASMLRPGGILLSNNVLVELPTTPLHAIGDTKAIYSDDPDDNDDIVWYRRQ
jgi:hypothetical protein